MPRTLILQAPQDYHSKPCQAQGQNHANSQAMAALSHTHVHRTIVAQHQLATHQHQLRASPSCTEGALSTHLGGHRYTKAGVSLLTPSPGNITLPVLYPRCPRPCHACHHPHAGG